MQYPLFIWKWAYGTLFQTLRLHRQAKSDSGSIRLEKKKERKKERKGKKIPEGMASIPFLLPCERVYVLTKRTKNSEAVLVL